MKYCRHPTEDAPTRCKRRSRLLSVLFQVLSSSTALKARHLHALQRFYVKTQLPLVFPSLKLRNIWAVRTRRFNVANVPAGVILAILAVLLLCVPLSFKPLKTPSISNTVIQSSASTVIQISRVAASTNDKKLLFS